MTKTKTACTCCPEGTTEAEHNEYARTAIDAFRELERAKVDATEMVEAMLRESKVRTAPIAAELAAFLASSPEVKAICAKLERRADIFTVYIGDHMFTAERAGLVAWKTKPDRERVGEPGLIH
jgi:hypothetical protein